MTGAVHLSNDNAGVLRPAQCGRKPHVEHKGKCWLDLSLQYGARSRNVGLSILFISEFEERGVRKVTTGITGLWQPSVLNNNKLFGKKVIITLTHTQTNKQTKK